MAPDDLAARFRVVGIAEGGSRAALEFVSDEALRSFASYCRAGSLGG